MNYKNKEVDNTLPLWYLKVRHSIYFILGVILMLIGFRIIFMLLSANPQNGFVSFIYSASRVFTAPFSGIFETFVFRGLAAKYVLEPAAIIGGLVYSILAWGLVSLIRIKAVKRI